MSETAVLFSAGSTEELPPGTLPWDVLDVQEGSLQKSVCFDKQQSHVYWSAGPAYLSGQINAFCSLATGQPVRGDAVLVSNLRDDEDKDAFVRGLQQQNEALHVSGPSEQAFKKAKRSRPPIITCSESGNCNPQNQQHLGQHERGDIELSLHDQQLRLENESEEIDQSADTAVFSSEEDDQHWQDAEKPETSEKLPAQHSPVQKFALKVVSLGEQIAEDRFGVKFPNRETVHIPPSVSERSMNQEVPSLKAQPPQGNSSSIPSSRRQSMDQNASKKVADHHGHTRDSWIEAERPQRKSSTPKQRQSEDCLEQTLAKENGASKQNVNAEQGVRCQDPRNILLNSIMGQSSSIAWPSLTEPSKSSSVEPSQKDQVITRGDDSAENMAYQSQQSMAIVLEHQTAAQAVNYWDSLPRDLVLKIAGTHKSADIAQLMIQTCKYWRGTILADPHLLKQLQLPDVSDVKVLNWPANRPDEWSHAEHPFHLPIDLKLAEKAAKAGNLSASLALGNVYTQMKHYDQAMQFWRRAARLGNPYAQWKYGLASYKGSHGVEYNLEEAYRWINKAVNQLCASSASPKRDSALKEASFHLGLLHLDGHGTKQDQEAAVKYLRIAAMLGLADAQMIFGYLIRTGQY